MILGDFARDGVPYLYAFSSLVEDNSFTVCGWHDGSAECVYEMEDWMGRSDAYLSEQADTGEVKLVESGSGGAAQAVPVPKWSDRQRMALAMLGELKSRITRCRIALPRCSMRSRS